MDNQIQSAYVCPYGDCHRLFYNSLTFGLHLRYCRMISAHELVVCGSNSTHIIPKLEFEFHMEICSKEGREVDSFIHQIRLTASETISHARQCQPVFNAAKENQTKDDGDQIVPRNDEIMKRAPLIV